jgi:hypothetical protein
VLGPIDTLSGGDAIHGEFGIDANGDGFVVCRRTIGGLPGGGGALRLI